MDPIRELELTMTRRQLFGRTIMGVGTAALSQLLHASGLGFLADQDPGLPKLGKPRAGIGGIPHFQPRAKRVIMLCMNGGPSQLDLFEHKPKLRELYDTDLPEDIRNGQRLTTMTSGQTRFPIAPTKYDF